MKRPTPSKIMGQRPAPRDAKATPPANVVLPNLHSIYLGMVSSESQEPRLNILAERSPSGQLSWRPLPAEARESAYLPWQSTDQAVDGSLWQFRLRSVADGNLDEGDSPTEVWANYSLDPATLEPVVEFMKAGEASSVRSIKPLGVLGAEFVALEELRERFFEKGLQSPPSNQTVLISKDEKFCIGPIQWQRASSEENAPFLADSGDLSAVPTIPIPELQSIKDIGGRTLRIVCSELKQPIAYFDFRPIKVIVAEQIHRMRVSTAPESGTLVQILDELLTCSPAPPRNSLGEFRLRTFLNAWDSSSDRNVEIERMVLDSPIARTILTEARQQAVEEEISTRKNAIDAMIADLQAKEEALRQRLQELNKSVDEAESRERKKHQSLNNLSKASDEARAEVAELEARRTELQALVGDLDATVARQAIEAEGALAAEITRLKGRSAAELAALLPLRHALGLDDLTVRLDVGTISLPPSLVSQTPLSPPANSSPGKLQECPMSPFSQESNRATAQHDDILDASKALEKELRAHGGEEWRSLAAPILAAFLAGLVPVVALEEIGPFWQTVANVLCGGRRLSVNLPPYASRPSDLIGEVQKEGFLPHPHQLADLLLTSRNALALTVLDEIDGVDWSAVLSPLLSARKEKRALPFLHPSLATQCGAYAELSGLVWPSSVLLAGTWRGWGVLPCPAFWKQAVLLVPESNVNDPIGSKSVVASLPSADWEDAITQASCGGQQLESVELGQMREEIRQIEGPSTAAIPFFLALRSLGKNHEDARRKTRTHVLMPWQIAHGRQSDSMDATRSALLKSVLFSGSL